LFRELIDKYREGFSVHVIKFQSYQTLNFNDGGVSRYGRIFSLGREVG